MTTNMNEEGSRSGRIVDALTSLPDEAITRMQYLQPEIGCFNSCGFCSQEAGTYVWQLTEDSLRELM